MVPVRKASIGAAIVVLAAAMLAGCAQTEAMVQQDRAQPLKQRSLNTLDQASQLGSRAE